MFGSKVRKALDEAFKAFDDLVNDGGLADDDRDFVEAMFVILSYFVMMDKIADKVDDVRVIEIVRDVQGNIGLEVKGETETEDS